MLFRSYNWLVVARIAFDCLAFASSELSVCFVFGESLIFNPRSRFTGPRLELISFGLNGLKCMRW